MGSKQKEKKNRQYNNINEKTGGEEEVNEREIQDVCLIQLNQMDENPD